MTQEKHPPEYQVLTAYRNNCDEFWSRKAKRIYSIFFMVLNHRRNKWDLLTSDLLAEIHHVWDSRGTPYMLQTTGESKTDFMFRLVSQLFIRKLITSQEKNALYSALSDRSNLPFLSNSHARAYILKGILELSRKHHVTAFAHLTPYAIRTIEELLSVPLNIPLPTKEDDFLQAVYKQWEFWGRPTMDADYLMAAFLIKSKTWPFSHDDLRQILEARAQWLNKGTVEAHLAAAHQYHDLEYYHAVESVARDYPSLPVAYLKLCSKNNRDMHELNFCKNHHHYMR